MAGGICGLGGASTEMISTGRVRRAGGTLVMTFTPRMSNFGIEQIRGMLFTATYHDECEG